MAKKLLGLSVFLWILIALVVLFFVYGSMEGFAGDGNNTSGYYYYYLNSQGKCTQVNCRATCDSTNSKIYRDSECTQQGCPEVTSCGRKKN